MNQSYDQQIRDLEKRTQSFVIRDDLQKLLANFENAIKACHTRDTTTETECLIPPELELAQARHELMGLLWILDSGDGECTIKVDGDSWTPEETA